MELIAESLSYKSFKVYVKESQHYIPFFGKAVRKETYGDLDEIIPLEFQKDFLKDARKNFLKDWRMTLIQHKFKKDLNDAHTTSGRNLSPIWIFHLKVPKRQLPDGVCQDSSLLIYERKDVSITALNTEPGRKLRPSQIHKIECRKVAQKLWKDDETITIKSMAYKDEINECFNGKTYGDNTIRKWIKDLCPNRAAGRRSKKN